MADERNKSVDFEETVIIERKKKKKRDNKCPEDGEKLGVDIVAKKKGVESESENDVKKSKKKKKKNGGNESESSKLCEGSQENRDGIDLEAQEMKRKSKKKKKKDKVSVEDSDVEENKTGGEENSEGSDLEAQETSNKELKRKSKKKKKKDKDGSVGEVNKTGGSESESLKAYEVSDEPLVDTDDSNKKKGNRKRDDTDLGAEENAEMKRKSKKKKKKKPSVEDSGVEDAEKEQNCIESDDDDDDAVTTPPSKKSARKVIFSDKNEVFVIENRKKKKRKRDDSELGAEENAEMKRKSKKKKKKKEKSKSQEREEEDEENKEKAKLVRGKRFTKEEDELVKKAVKEYIDNHALGDEGLKMVLACKAYPQVKGCWEEIRTALPWRPKYSVYHRAHTLFEEGSRGVWTDEDFELVKEFKKKHGSDWRTLADAMGKSRKHVKDAWRRVRLAEKNKGHWSREEYQNLYDSVNKELKMKAFKEKHSKHGMLRDNIPWMAISDKLGTRDHVVCCSKWYDQLTSPMVTEGKWANVDDYRLLEELVIRDAACIDDVDWDDLLENRDGEACRKRWNQMVRHIGSPATKTFAEQVEILSERYCPDLAEDREDFDSRPFDPED